MIKHAWTIAALAILAACAPSQFKNGTTTVVDGQRFFVQEMRNDPGVWYAITDQPTIEIAFTLRPSLYAKNIKAIEQVTGCKVVASSVYHWDHNTWAKVEC